MSDRATISPEERLTLVTAVSTAGQESARAFEWADRSHPFSMVGASHSLVQADGRRPEKSSAHQKPGEYEHPRRVRAAMAGVHALQLESRPDGLLWPGRWPPM